MKRFILSALLFSSLSAAAAEKVFLMQKGADSRAGLRSLGPVEGALELAVPDSGGHLLVLTNRGHVLAWGDNRAGQLGSGDLDSRAEFSEVHGLGQAAAIAAGTEFSAALKSDGTVWTWGWGRTSAEPAAGLWDILRIAAGDDFLLAVRSDGTLWSLGKQGQAEQVDGLWDVTAVAARGAIRYARDATGRIWTWRADGAPLLLDAFDSGAAQAKFAGVPTEWLGSALRIEGNNLRLGQSEHPFSGNVVDVEAGWSVALITSDTPAAVSSTSSTGERAGEAKASSTPAPAFYGKIGGERLVSSSPLITSTETHSLFLQGGKVCGFGVNAYGQLGDGTAVNRSTPVPAAHMSSLSIISSGLYHSAALKSDGTVYTWGYNAYGQLGDNSTTNRPAPFVIAGLTNIAAVSAGGYHTLVLRNDGTVWAFGYNGYGELGDGTFTNRTTAVQVIGLTGVTAISAGHYFSVALKSDNTVWTWGRNSYGNLGDGTTTSRSSPVQAAGLTGVTAIAASYYHALVSKSDGTVWGFGYNGYGALGDGSTTNRLNAVRAGTLTGVTSIGVGEYHSLAVKGDGTVWTFGLNTQGQLGDGTIVNRNTPVQVSGFTNAARATGGSLHSVAAKNDGSIWAWGDNNSGQLGNGTTTDSTVPTATSACGSDPTTGPTPSSAPRLISAEETHSLAVKSDGSAFGWGLNTNGELGDGTSTNRNTPSQTSGLTGVNGVSAGYYHGAAARSDGTVRTWGYNAYGELGDGTNTSKTSPVAVSGLSGVTAVSAGGYHTLALRSDGTVWGFGYNGYGELGDGSNTNRNVPVQVVGLTNVTAIAAGHYFSAALKSDGTVWTWGRNSYGNLGDGTFTSRSSPVQVAQLSGVVAITASYYHTLFLKNDGTVWGVGYSGYGALGDGSDDNRPNIVRASGLTNVVAIAAGEYHSLAVKSDGTVWSFGLNTSGQLGDGSVVTKKVPVQTAGGLSGVIAAAAGSLHSLALKSDGKIFVWGSNAQGQFGIATPASSTVPIEGSCCFSAPVAVPVITALTPGTVNAGSAAFNLDVSGLNFTNQSVVRWNGSARTTTYLNASTLRAQISATDVATAGTVPITVFDPANGTSTAVTFTINTFTVPVGPPTNPNPADNTSGLATTTSVGWTAATNATSYDVYFSTSSTPTFVANLSGTTYNPGPLSLNTQYFWRIVARNGADTNSGPVWKFTTTTGVVPTGLRFVPVVPCRLADTRAGGGFGGNFGPPTLNSGVTREMTIPAGACGIPASAKAFSFNVTVVPAEPLSYLTMWPTGQGQPLVSTLNSFHGGIVANAAIVPAGTSGSVSIFVTNRADVILDINGYFDDNLAVTSYSFYSVDPCRLADTRTGSGFSGLFGAPTPTASETRSFPLAGRCNLPAAAAYSLNVTVVPPAPLSFLTIFPTGSTRPLVSTLNSFDGAIVANAAIVPAGANGAVSTFVTHVADQILDVNGYFGASGGANELRFNAITPCRVADTRITGQGAPIMNAGTQKDFPVAGVCGVPTDAKAYSLNVTVVPTGGLSFLTLWPAGKTRPQVSTLNSFLGRVVANAAIAPAGTNGNVSVFVTDQTHVILDINGYFR